MPKIPQISLGGTGLSVSRLGFGTFDFGVKSLKIPPEEGGSILAESFKLGINFWDTAEDYGSAPHVACALRRVPRRNVVISTKTDAKTGKEAEESLKKSLEELETDYIDIFLLHLVKSDWIDGCQEVLKELDDLKKTGMIRATGLSTHSVAVVKEASFFADVIMAVCCKASPALVSRYREHIPLEDGTMEEMYDALRLAHDRGKATIAMKVLGTAAPPLVKEYKSALISIARLPFIDAMVVGMKSMEEVRRNVEVIRAIHRGKV